MKLCHNCNRTPPAEGRANCARCLEACALAQVRLRERRRATGRCLLCYRPREGAFSCCAYHREQKRWRDMLPESRAKQAAAQKQYRQRKAARAKRALAQKKYRARKAIERVYGGAA